MTDAHDVLVLGTGVPEAVLSAALSRAGRRVLHVDTHDYYGADWASLTLTELLAWGEQHGAHVAFPRDAHLPDALARLDRHYSLSVRPALLPAHGPMIEALVRSNVAAYATFRLLDRVGVYDAAAQRVDRVPSSKSEIFRHKHISLADKRRLMRFLERALGAPAASTAPPEPLAHTLDALQLDARLQRAVQYGVCLAWNGEETTDTALARTRHALAGLGRYGDAAFLVGQYGGAGELAQGFCRASAVQGATFVLGHGIQSLTRVGDRWELRLDGVDETFSAAQLACSAEARAAATGDAAPIVAPLAYEHLGIVVADAPIDWVRLGEEPATLETALLVLPPGSVAGVDNAVMVLMQGEGTFSCPKGQYVYYLVTHAPHSDASRLQGAVDVLMQLLEPAEQAREPGAGEDAQPATPTHAAPVPLVTLFHARPIYDRAEVPQTTPASVVDTSVACPYGTQRSSLFLEPRGPFQRIPNPAETLDLAVEQAEHAFWRLYTPAARDAALDAAAARRQHHDPAEYQGRGGAEPDLTRAPPHADVEFLAPRDEEDS
ncbi:hypothetical protein MOBT1_000599 [Malassezia obtusa]|uniref:Rab proteins geranylgeranyltransferase component A n=1 Tax=Malassezia obtusa TaxID=76774 RepID=A0AAF0DZK6_9BASI|nr:hypothetical protein MOBT1_000599 [Malassezia obtusa]